MVTPRDATSLYVGNTPSAAIPKPTVVDGDHVMLFAGGRENRAIVTPPTGFDPIFNAISASGSGNARCVAYLKHIPVAASEPATYDLEWDGAPFGIHFAVSLIGADLIDTIDVFATLPDLEGGANINSPGVVTTVDDCLLLFLGLMSRDGGFAAGSWAPTNATELEDPGTALNAGQKVGAALAWEMAGAAGATSAETWTVTAADFGNALGITVAISPPVLLADADADQTVSPGQLVVLNGSDSRNATSWTWSQVGGTPDVSDYLVPGTGADESDATFYAPEGPGTLTFQLEVGDGVDTDTDTCVVTLTEAAPSAPIEAKVRVGGVWV